MKLSRFQDKSGQPKSGFTLIELLVVIIIIGILAGLLIPAIGAAMRRSKEALVQKDVQDLAGAIENFKSKFGVYPIDFKNGNVVQPFVGRLSDRQAYDRILVSTGFYVLAPNEALPNPHQASSGGPYRYPRDIDAAECYVFFLYELTNNSEYPLGYVYDVNDADPGSNWLIDNNGQRTPFFSFRETNLTDVDGDGWLEYVADTNKPVPYCYFDSRSYLSQDPAVVTSCLYRGNEQTGTCVPYSNRADVLASGSQPFLGFQQPQAYQLISAGVDGAYGEYWDPSDASLNPLEVRRCTDFTQIKYNAGWGDEDDINRLHNPPNLNSVHNDNFVQFFEGRIDSNKQ